MLVSRDQIVEQARTYLGVRWRHQGRSRTGIDCVGLLACVALDLGLVSTLDGIDLKGYRRSTNGHLFLKYLDGALTRKPLNRREPGDVIGMRDGTVACHVGLLSSKSGCEYLIHAWITSRKVVEDQLDAHMPRVIACWSLPGVS